ncbi:hypothetical protein NHQ30_011689 [Ciborinia camelliae]|nr:hypothetical protein NHQ30_011689 [Ciborinia camelliae]
MRLINAKTLDLEEFYGNSIPGYAILSHTWGLQKDEVSFQDWQFRKQESTKKPGFFKITATCKQALLNNLDYAWVDTMCIDKTSSAELSEAINSMFAWYRNAVVCYVYLSDVSNIDKRSFPEEKFRASRWFTRGWTLQELLAPAAVVFYSCEWVNLGTKSHLGVIISKITGIDHPYLNTPQNIKYASVAEKMYWASGRTTNRPEDIAYSLLGVFDITMPLLYGEGDRAFMRLQEEIIKVSPDHTIFCWSWIDEVIPYDWGSVLAPFPSAFKFSKDFWPIPHKSPHSMTNTGLSIEARIIEALRYYLVVLMVARTQDNGGTNVCIPVISYSPGSYARMRYMVQPLPIPAYWIHRFPKRNIFIESKMVGSQQRLFNEFAMPVSSEHSPLHCYMEFKFNEESSNTSLDVEVDNTLVQSSKHQNGSLRPTKALAGRDGPNNLLSFLIALKTSEGKFLIIAPTFRFKTWDTLNNRTIGGLIRLTGDELNCTLFIGRTVMYRPYAIWYCGVLRMTSWGKNRKERASLLKGMLTEVVHLDRGTRTSFFKDHELRNEISMVQLLASSRSLASMALGDSKNSMALGDLKNRGARFSFTSQKNIKIDTYRLHTSC